MITVLASLTATVLLGIAASFGWQTTTPASQTPTTPLSSQEEADLRYMREEERLARDVYTALFAEWQLPVFNNIAAAEQAHMDAVKALLDRYGLSDPAAGKAPGVFTDPALQALYDDLIVQGSASVEAAIAAGVLIEKTDIADLKDSLSQTTHADIGLVYNNLLRASNNHLAAFERQAAGGGSGSGFGRGPGGRGQGAGNGAGLGQGNGQGQGTCTGDCTGLGLGQGAGSGMRFGRGG
jgi:hypothetical protein